MLVALVGKPSVGKSCFFKAATLAEVEIHERPFTTIKASGGEAYVKVDCIDKEFNVQCQPKHGFCLNNNRFVPFKLMDVPGLIEKSYEGRGLGNIFLDDLNEANALIHVIDISGSTDAEGNPVPPLSYNPEKDIEFLETELNQWYLRILKKGWEKFARILKQENKNIKQALAKQLSGLRVTEEIIETTIKELNLTHDPSSWTNQDLLSLASNLRKKTKPMLIAANKIDVKGAKFNLEKLKKKFPDYKIIPCSAESELALREAAKSNLISYIPGQSTFKILKKEKLSEKQLQALNFLKKFLKENKTTGIQETLNEIVFNLLNYIAVFPGGVNKLSDKDGNILPDCHLLEKDSTALDFAYRIHKDLGDNFIKAIDVKTKRAIGKETKLKHRNIIEIITGK